MARIPESVKKQIANPQPDIQRFIAALTGRAKPNRVPLAELFADQEMMQWVTENVFQKKWIAGSEDRRQIEKHLRCEIEYWHRMGYDYIRVTGGLVFPSHGLQAADPAGLSRGQRGWVDGHHGPIQSWDDFNGYAWPTVKDENLWTYHFVAEHLPEGMGMFVCPHGGFLEIPMNCLVGCESLAMMTFDAPDLVRAIFDRTGELIVEVYRRLVKIPQVVGFFQGDDMGFRSGTIFSPEFLRTHSLPGHKELVELAHAHDKLYLLHACGNLDAIADYLIDEIGIDGRHSYEDRILPVEQAYRRYGRRIAILGGLDVDILARGEEQAVRERAREILNACASGGRYAFGSGNSITNYCKPENVLAMFDEAFTWAR